MHDVGRQLFPFGRRFKNIMTPMEHCTIVFNNIQLCFTGDGNRSNSESNYASSSRARSRDDLLGTRQQDEQKPILLTPDSFTGPTTQSLYNSHVQDYNTHYNTVPILDTNQQFLAKPDIYTFQQNEFVSQNMCANVPTTSPLQLWRSTIGVKLTAVVNNFEEEFYRFYTRGVSAE